jgi:uncharacterized damage-inducible protein DinB
MNARPYFATLARYNAWATRRLFGHVDALPEADYRRDAGLFFRSIHGTLNHLLVAEHGLWRRRFAEGVSPRLALDAELETGRHRLRERLIEGAEGWAPLIASWPEDRFEGLLEYTSTQGVAIRLPVAPTLAHVFNHGTHHRAQITAAITALGRPCPELDMVWMLQEESRA